jgi:hypothetical protein
MALLAPSCSDPPVDPPPQVYGDAPPPIVGGGLVVTSDDTVAIASDLDRDRLWFFDVIDRALLGSVELSPGDRPNRLVIDSAGRVHVALREGGAVATVDIASRQLLQRSPVCPAPRGIDVQPEFQGVEAVHVACATGELVTVDASSGDVLRTLQLGPDLRDVVVVGDHVIVSRLRSAEVLEIDAEGQLVAESKPQPVAQVDDQFLPRVARRLIPFGPSVAMLHQREKSNEFDVDRGAYTRGMCAGGAVVHSTISLYGEGLEVAVGSYMPFAALPVDFAISPAGDRVLLVDPAKNQLLRFPLADFTKSPCWGGLYTPERVGEWVLGQPVAVVGLRSTSQAVVFSREPASFFVVPFAGAGTSTVTAGAPFDAASVAHEGHDLFHRPAFDGGIIGCANCHIEGGDDAHVWRFKGIGPRRTIPLQGDITDSLPFHWSGDLLSLSALYEDTLTKRLGGVRLDAEQEHELTEFLKAIPALPAPPITDPDAVERGAELFRRTGCIECHVEPNRVDPRSFDVGTGELLQVPMLRGVWARAPFMHDGCAPTLRERFDPACGGDNHGSIDDLDPEAIDDLVSFLQSL